MPPLAAELAAVLEGGSASREGALCVQAVFRLLDVLAKWVAGARDAAAAAAGGARPPARPLCLGACWAGRAVCALRCARRLRRCMAQSAWAWFRRW